MQLVVLRPVAQLYGQVRMFWNQRFVVDCWAQTVHMFTLRLHVSRDFTVTPCAKCVFLFAFLRVYLRPRRVLHGLLLRVV